MNPFVGKLNEVLAVEWACVRALRGAESACDDPGRLEVIKRVRKDSSVNCVTLAQVVRALDGRPADVPSLRFTPKPGTDTLAALDVACSAGRHVMAEIETLIDEPDLASVRGQLNQVRELHREDLRWLDTMLSAGQ